MRLYAVKLDDMEQKREERLRHKLEIQSMQIEGVFEQHQIPSRVAGGQVGPGWVRFDLQTSLAAAMERMHQIKADLSRVLASANITLSPQKDRLHIEVAQPSAEAVNLLDLLAVVPPLPPITAAMGWSDDDRPVVVDLLKPEAAHLLVAGSEGAGKTVLLRTMALSLAMSNKPSRLQLVVIDGDAAADPAKAHELAPLNYLPHILTPVVDDVATAKEILTFLVREAEYRQSQAVTTPAIGVFVDGADYLLGQKDAAIAEALRQLVQSGAKAGIHLVLSTNQPTASYLDNLFKASFPARIVGKVVDTAAARAASGQSDSQAESLLGEGDFIAFAGGSVSHFQAAFIGGTDLLQTLETLHHRRLPVLVAQTTSIRPTLQPSEEEPPTVREFVTDTRDEIAFVEEYGEESQNDQDDEISFLDDIE